MKIAFALSSFMGVETPIPPIMMNAAAPYGAPPRQIKDAKQTRKTSLARHASERP